MAKEAMNTVTENVVMNEAEKAASELAALKAQLAEAKAKLADAKAKAKKATGRPIRKCCWAVYDNVAAEGEPIHKGDVHYCEEKFAIDAIKAGDLTEAWVAYQTKVEDSYTFIMVQHLYLDKDGCLTIE